MSILHGRRILIIEDETMIAMMLEDTLQQAGAAVLGPVGTLALAFELLRRDPPDLVLLDLQLGQDSAVSVAEWLHQRGIPFIICTGFGDPGLPAGVMPVKVLTKPLDIDELLAAIISVPGASPGSGSV